MIGDVSNPILQETIRMRGIGFPLETLLFEPKKKQSIGQKNIERKNTGTKKANLVYQQNTYYVHLLYLKTQP